MAAVKTFLLCHFTWFYQHRNAYFTC